MSARGQIAEIERQAELISRLSRERDEALTQLDDAVALLRRYDEAKPGTLHATRAFLARLDGGAK